jgi:hypothetical protein
LKKFNIKPEDRAQLVIKKLEQAIREKRIGVGPLVKGKQQRGMSYKQWQKEAQKEISNAIKDALREKDSQDAFFNRFLMIAGACLVALGFMGAYVAFGDVEKMFVASAGMALGISFLALGFEWIFRLTFKEVTKNIRDKRLQKIKSYDRQLKILESKLEDTKDELKNRLEIYD